MKQWHTGFMVGLVALVMVLGGCSRESTPTEHYVSPQIKGETQRINLDSVQKAFWDSKGKDLNSWMSAFEKRVNEIYDGKEIISIDSRKISVFRR